MSKKLSKISEEAVEFKEQTTREKLERTFPFKKFEFRKGVEEKPLPLDKKTLKKFEELFKQANNLVLITDLDGTVLTYEKNPKDCKINFRAKEALEQLQKTGVTIAAMTGRSGAEGAAKLEIPGAIILNGIPSPIKLARKIQEQMPNNKNNHL